MQNTLSNQTCAVWALFKKEIQIKIFISKLWSEQNFERAVVRVVLGI